MFDAPAHAHRRDDGDAGVHGARAVPRARATDARTDQFSFCVALYEALYGERPFAGNTMFALTSNVVQGKVREAPASSKVPLWVRKVLLRGLRPRRPSAIRR